MRNITLAIDEDLLKKARAYAQKHRLSLNALIRKLLEEKVLDHHDLQLEACFELMDTVNVSSANKSWPRKALYER